MNEEITKEQGRIILLMARKNFQDHVRACNECEWIELEDESDLNMCEVAFDLNAICEKWLQQSLGIRTLLGFAGFQEW